MIFEDFASFLKPYLLASDPPLKDVLLTWFYQRLSVVQGSKSEHIISLIQSEFKLIELGSFDGFLIVPRSGRSAYLLQLLNEYVCVMEERRMVKLSSIRKK